MMYQLLSTLCNKLVMLFYLPWPSENLRKKILPLFYALFSCNKLFPCFLSNFMQKCNLTHDKFICHHSAVSNCFIKCGISIHPQVCIYNKCILLISLFLKCFWFMLRIVTHYFFLLSNFQQPNAAGKYSKSIFSQLVGAGKLILHSFVILDLKVMSILICISASCLLSHSSFFLSLCPIST